MSVSASSFRPSTPGVEVSVTRSGTRFFAAAAAVAVCEVAADVEGTLDAGVADDAPADVAGAVVGNLDGAVAGIRLADADAVAGTAVGCLAGVAVVAVADDATGTFAADDAGSATGI